MRRIAALLSLASLTFAVTGCGAARLRDANRRAMAAADARVLEGCYDCLLEARDVYTKIVASKDKKTAALVLPRLFETELLLALREKELALDTRATLERARAIASRVPPRLEANRLLAMVDAVLPDQHGVPPKAMSALRQRHRAFSARINGELEWLTTAPLTPAVREYVSLALDCSYWARVRPGAPVGPRQRPDVPPGAPPLIAYRTAICVGQDTAVLARVRAAVPGFKEAAYYAAQTTAFLSGETGDDEAPLLLEAAYTRFPRAPGVTFIYGWFNTAIGDCEPAVRFFDETIAIEPAHERAYMERTVCLTNLRQDSAAIESATRLIALETGSTGQAYYWRAVNRLRRKELAMARRDIEDARKRSESDNILTLAGIIEHDQEDLTPAERDLRDALAWPRGDKNCTASWYLAQVLRKRTRWRESGSQFETAMGCYDAKVRENRALIAKIEAHPKMTAALKAKRIEKLVADSVDQRKRYHAAAFNAGNTKARDGEFARAEELLALAGGDTDLTDAIGRLRAEIKAILASRGQSTRPAHHEQATPPRP